MTAGSGFNRPMSEQQRPATVERAELRLQAAETDDDDQRLAALEQIYRELEGELEK
jgi:hypothetical protein